VLGFFSDLEEPFHKRLLLDVLTYSTKELFCGIAKLVL
jgi:hypothetical protein